MSDNKVEPQLPAQAKDPQAGNDIQTGAGSTLNDASTYQLHRQPNSMGSVTTPNVWQRPDESRRSMDSQGKTLRNLYPTLGDGERRFSSFDADSDIFDAPTPE